MATQRRRTGLSGRGQAEVLPHREWRLRLIVGMLVTAASAALLLSACSDTITNDGDDTGSAQNEGHDTEVAQTGPVEIIGDPLAPFEQPDPAVGEAAPVIVAESFGGEQLRLGGDGVARVIGFFAHWCPHCQAELPRLVGWLESIAVPEGVEVAAISTAVDPSEGNYPPSEWFEREGYEGLLLRDSPDYALATGYGLRGFPYWVVVGADGSVVNRVTGEINTEIYETLLAQAAATVG